MTGISASCGSHLPCSRAAEKAADGCFCTHESNCYYPSLPFNPQHLIQIKRLEKEMANGWKGSRQNAIG